MRSRALLVVGGLVAVLVLVWIGLYAAAGSGIAKGTTVLGVDIGGQSQAEAASTLTRELRDEERAAIPVLAAGHRAAVHPAKAGLTLDVTATVDSAKARSWNPLHLLHALGGGGAVAPVVQVDREALRAAVDTVGAKVDRDVVEGSLRFGAAGVPKPVDPVEGRTLARRDAVRALVRSYLVAAYLHGGAPVELPVRVVAPKIGRAEVRRATRDLATPATSAPVHLTVEGTDVVVPPRAVAAALTFAPDGHGKLTPVLDGAVLHASLAAQLAPVETPAVDATFRIEHGRPTVVPSQSGREVLPATLSTAVLPALTKAGAERTVTVPLEASEPTVTTAVAQGLGVTELVSSFTTYYPTDFGPRLTNIHHAADLMDRTLVLPGKVFSLNQAVGERTKERGFAAGFVIDDGQLGVDYGGGVSQLATTTFNAAYFAGLKIVEHHPHSFYISRYPEGRESTVAWGFKDMRFRNDSGHGVFVTTSWTTGSVSVRIYGTKRYRIESVKGPRFDIKPFKVVQDKRPEGVDPGDCVATEGVPGFRVVVTRQFFQGGSQVRSEKFRTKYAPENEVRCGS